MLQGYNASNAPRANQETNQGDGHSLEVSANDVNIVRVDAIKSLSLFLGYLLSGECQQEYTHDIELHVIGHIPAPHHAHLVLREEVIDVKYVAPPIDAARVVLDLGRLEDG